MKKVYEKLETEILWVQSDEGFMAASVVDKIQLKVEVDDYIETDSFTIGFE